SAFAVIERLLALPSFDVGRYNLQASQLPQLDLETVENVQDELREFVNRGGLRVWRGDSPWSKARVHSEGDVKSVLAHLDALAAGALRDAQQRVQELVDQVGLHVADDLAAWNELLDLL